MENVVKEFLDSVKCNSSELTKIGPNLDAIQDRNIFLKIRKISNLNQVNTGNHFKPGQDDLVQRFNFNRQLLPRIDLFLNFEMPSLKNQVR